MTSVTIYHNPRCSKSRQTLQLLEERGLSVNIIKYLETPPSTETISELLRLLKLSPRELMRSNEAEYKDNNLKAEDLSDEALIQAMHDFPKLIERPIVVANKQAKIGRPPEAVLDIL